jgi:hypothetical protein
VFYTPNLWEVAREVAIKDAVKLRNRNADNAKSAKSFGRLQIPPSASAFSENQAI